MLITNKTAAYGKPLSQEDAVISVPRLNWRQSGSCPHRLETQYLPKTEAGSGAHAKYPI